MQDVIYYHLPRVISGDFLAMHTTARYQYMVYALYRCKYSYLIMLEGVALRALYLLQIVKCRASTAFNLCCHFT